LDGDTFCLGVAEDPAHREKPYYIPRERIEQARGMVRKGQEVGVRFVLPIDFVLADGSVADELGPADQQLDVGPKTSALFETKVGEFLRDQPAGGVAFHNGVFGMFEDPRFEQGTKSFIGQLKRLTEAGVEVYIGGGEGGAALEKYGQSDWVTHVFTAGGTVLNALGSKPVPYLVALRAAAM
jgi:3-phosphoglycerate kinase